MSIVFLDIAGLSGQAPAGVIVISEFSCNTSLIWKRYGSSWGVAEPSSEPGGPPFVDAPGLLRNPTARSPEPRGAFSEVRRNVLRRCAASSSKCADVPGAASTLEQILCAPLRIGFDLMINRWPVTFSYGGSYPLDSLWISCYLGLRSRVTADATGGSNSSISDGWVTAPRVLRISSE